MLYFFFHLTSHFPGPLEAARVLIQKLEVPLVQFIFKSFGARIMVPRNSIFDAERFNLFLSDIDFSVVGNSEDFPKLLSVHHCLKKVLVNLGEIELYTEAEWETLSVSESSPLNSYWTTVYLIRKLKWQSRKLEASRTRYESLKHERGIAITLERLNSKSISLKYNDVFSGLVPESPSQKFYLPRYSSFLEHQLTLSPAPGAIFFSSPEEVSTLLKVLPETEENPAHLWNKQVKHLLIKRERLLTLTSMRVRNFSSAEKKLAEKWLEDLDRREHSLSV
jgi:hypothetical protein